MKNVESYSFKTKAINFLKIRLDFIMKKILLINGDFTLVDDADYDWLNQYVWHSSGGGGYIQNDLSISEECAVPLSPISYMHRLILGLEHGDLREGDHINHNILDNQRHNLRICTHAENQHNRSLTKRHTSSRFKGVTWNKHAKKWRARIRVDSIGKFLGYFSKEKYAAQAYNLAAKRYFGEFAFLNKIS